MGETIPRIDDEVYVHGYIDEIRKDIIIVRNDGGYFGTVFNEIIVDRKTEPQTHDLRTDTHECVKDTHDKTEPQTCDTCRYDKEPWHRQVCDECTVGESNWTPKTEPQTATLYDQIVEDIDTRVKCANAKKIEDEPQTDCSWK